MEKSKILGMSSGTGQYIEVGLMNIWFVITYEMNYQKFSGLRPCRYVLLQLWRSEIHNQFHRVKVKVSGQDWLL